MMNTKTITNALHKEMDFARKQRLCWKKIVKMLNAFKLKKNTLNGAYFEWIIWRAFLALAMSCLKNKPWEARKFPVNRYFKPINHAPAHTPDMIFEFADFVLVVEVTLISSSRQEAMEGESVRRHCANMMDQFTDKNVYCLFISPKIDNNTAETFRFACWYKDNTKLPLQIVPLSLPDFVQLFCSIYKLKYKGKTIKQFMLACLSSANRDAPEWKKAISNEVKKITRYH